MKQCYLITLCFVCFAFAISSYNFVVARSSAEKREHVIIDTDAGADDAMAILLALINECNNTDNKFKIIAITCTYGNTYLENVEQNVLKTLTVANRSDIPVYAGAQRPFLNNYTASDYFGKDGLGDFKFDKKITAKVDRSKHASVAIVELTKIYSNVSIICLGPLTNVAIAKSLDNSFPKRVQRFYVMGGSVAGIGNTSPGVEFNFNNDPDSNKAIFESFKKQQALLLPWETVFYSYIPKDWRLNVLGQLNNSYINFLNKAERVNLDKDGDDWYPSDVMMVAIIICPELVTKSLVTNVRPINDGEAKGSTLVDYSNLTNKTQNAEIILKFDISKFKDILLRSFG